MEIFVKVLKIITFKLFVIIQLFVYNYSRYCNSLHRLNFTSLGKILDLFPSSLITIL